jgi:putative FmdB family regulatory protein
VPIYDYKCRDCGTVKEVLVRRLEDRARCPECGSEAMEKLVSASYRINMNASAPGTTCCGRAERCDSPPCSTGRQCHRH